LIRKKKNKQGQFCHFLRMLGAPAIMLGAPNSTLKRLVDSPQLSPSYFEKRHE